MPSYDVMLIIYRLPKESFLIVHAMQKRTWDLWAFSFHFVYLNLAQDHSDTVNNLLLSQKLFSLK